MVEFRLKRRERAGLAVRRALAEDLAEAQAMLAGGKLPFEARVHKVRRKLKRDRSLLRVFERGAPVLSRQLRILLRDSGRALAGLREGHALAAAAESLSKGLDQRAEAVLAAAVPQDEAPTAEAVREPLAHASALIEEARRLVGTLPTKGGRRRFNEALARAHRQAGKAFRRAKESRATEDLHEWRKRLKVVVHLTQFGGKRLKRTARLLAASARAEELLGDDQDLAMLRNRVVKQGRTATARFVSNVEIGGRRAKLQRRAFKLGRRIERTEPARLR